MKKIILIFLLPLAMLMADFTLMGNQLTPMGNQLTPTDESITAEPTPTPVTEPEPTPTPVDRSRGRDYYTWSSTTSPVTEPTPTPAAEPEPTPTPVTEPTPTPVTEPTPTPAAEPEPTPTPVTEPAPTPVDSSAIAELIYDDMHGGEHEDGLHPHGVPAGYDFAQGPVLQSDRLPLPSHAVNIVGWGQIYEELQGNPATNTRVEFRNHRTYVLSKSTNTWRLLHMTPQPNFGTGYMEDFSNDNMHVDMSRTEDNGNTSVKPGDGYCYHFYSGWEPITPSDVAGVVTLYEAKLIVENPQLPDDRDSARFVASGGIDVYTSTGYIHDIGIGKFKWVTKEWRTFTTSTDLSLEQLQNNPPPLN